MVPFIGLADELFELVLLARPNRMVSAVVAVDVGSGHAATTNTRPLHARHLQTPPIRILASNKLRPLNIDRDEPGSLRSTFLVTTRGNPTVSASNRPGRSRA